MSLAKKKEEIIEAAKKAFGKKFNAEKYWQWRNKYSDVKITKEMDMDRQKVTFTYPCDHNVEFEFTNIECGKLRLADYHNPFCPQCREASFKAACKEKDMKHEGMVALGMIFEEAEKAP